jgi:hypothetical protein
MIKVQNPTPNSQRSSNDQSPTLLGGRLRLGAWRFSGYWILAVGALSLCLSSFGAPSNRFLFIVETSRPMKARQEGVLTTVSNLLASGIKGRLLDGDTIGLWTYNQALSAGNFPLQKWAPEQQEAIASRATLFLKAQHYEKTPDFGIVTPNLSRIVDGSESLTVLIIGSGEGAISGTPFDEEINRIQKQWRDEQAKAHMPLVTALRVERGKFTDFKVTAAPWAIELPPLRKVEPVVKGASPALGKLLGQLPPSTNQPAPVRASPVPPLIVSGRKPAKLEPLGLTERELPRAETASPTNEASATPATLVSAPPPAEPAVATASNLASATLQATSGPTLSAASAPPTAVAPTGHSVGAIPSLSVPGESQPGWPLRPALVGILLLVAVCGGCLFWFHNHSHSGSVSLITHSLERKR